MVSVIMPVYNAEKYIYKSIHSILNQTLSDIELIVVDDCGTDNSMDIVRSFKDSRIKILKNKKNMGIAFSRNRAINASNGKYIAIMDDDDIAPLNRLKIEKEVLEDEPSVSVVGGITKQIDENDNFISKAFNVVFNPKRIKAEIMFKNQIVNSSAMIRKQFIVENNLFYRDNYLGMEDYKFWTECSVCGNLMNIDELLIYYRVSGNNETNRINTQKAKERERLYAQIQKDALRLNGFILSPSEENIFCRVFMEDKRKYNSLEDLKLVHGVLNKIILQAKERKLDYLNELEFVCHRMFALRTEYSEIWE